VRRLPDQSAPAHGWKRKTWQVCSHSAYFSQLVFLAEMHGVVAEKDDDRVVAMGAFIEGVENAADLFVNVRQ
jgi:hypothetical protein